MPENYWTLQPEEIEHLIWSHWPVERLVYVFLAIAWLAVWAQVTLLHWRGGFRSPFMWGPVVYTPILALTSLILALYRVSATEALFVITQALGVLEGLFGAYKHLGGVKSHIGGFTLRNFIQGPPAVLPIIYAALALFALTVYYWDELVPNSKPYYEPAAAIVMQWSAHA